MKYRRNPSVLIVVTATLMVSGAIGCAAPRPFGDRPVADGWEETPVSLLHSRSADAGSEMTSGLPPGSGITAWQPRHITGPEAGTRRGPLGTCPDQPGVLVFAKDTANTVSLANRLESLASDCEADGLKIFLVLTDGTPQAVRAMARANQLERISICLLDPQTRIDDLATYRISEQPENTVMVYTDGLVEWRQADLRSVHFDELETAVQQALRRHPKRGTNTADDSPVTTALQKAEAMR
jgi:hypothetical protein